MQAEIFNKISESSQTGILNIKKKTGANKALANVNLFDNFILISIIFELEKVK